MPPFSSSQSSVLTIHGLAAPFLGFLALFLHFSLNQSIVLLIHGLALTFYLACGDWDQSMLLLSAGGSLNTRKEAGFLTLPRQNLFTYHLPGNASEGDDIGDGIPA